MCVLLEEFVFFVFCAACEMCALKAFTFVRSKHPVCAFEASAGLKHAGVFERKHGSVLNMHTEGDADQHDTTFHHPSPSPAHQREVTYWRERADNARTREQRNGTTLETTMTKRGRATSEKKSEGKEDTIGREKKRGQRC